MNTSQNKISAIRLILIIGFVILIIKFIAYFLTNSNGILTDALESVVNVIAGTVAFFGLKYAAKPKDSDHPYGHGKIEFVTAGFEGGLILFTGTAMIAKSVYNFIYPQSLEALDWGILLTFIGGVANGVLGIYLKRKGNELKSPALKGEGAHLLSDAYSSLGLIIGLLVILFTQKVWIDNAIAILFGLFIGYTGIKIIGNSLSGLLDKTDFSEINDIIVRLNQNRKPDWIDIHNLRMQKFGSNLHIDLHITFPWYYNLQKVHQEMDAVETLLNQSENRKIEVFIHPDPCIPKSCNICMIADCSVRQKSFQKRIDWNEEYLLPNKKHGVE